MSTFTVVALWAGYWTLFSVAGLLALLVGTLVHDAIWPPPSPSVLRVCSHAREDVASRLGALTYRCLDCGRTRELGPVLPSAYCHRRAS